MKRIVEMGPGLREFVRIGNLSDPILQPEGTRMVRPLPTTRAEKEEIVREAYSQGYFRLLLEKQRLLLGLLFLGLGNENYIKQSTLASRLGMTRSWVSHVEKESVLELDRYKRLIDGEEVDDNWRQSLLENPEALSYLYSRFRTYRRLAGVLKVKHREMPSILRSKGVNIHPGHPSLDLHKVFRDDPRGEITRLRKLGYTIEKLAWLFCISDRTMKNVIKDLGLQDVKPDK